MLLAALIIGLVTAYYLGFRAGGVAAVISAALFLLAAIIPPLAIPAYAVVGTGVAAVCVVGPRVQKDETRQRFQNEATKLARRLWGWRRGKRD
jgi:hypothetical protein